MIRQVKGNMFDYVTESDYIAHCISADFALGAGIAKTIDQKYNVRSKLLSNPVYKKPYSDGNGYVICTDHVFNLVTKARYNDKPTYASLDNALVKLAELCKCRKIDTIHMPRIGCGLDKLHWDLVFPMICRIFTEYGINVTIYHL